MLTPIDQGQPRLGMKLRIHELHYPQIHLTTANEEKA